MNNKINEYLKVKPSNQSQLEDYIYNKLLSEGGINDDDVYLCDECKSQITFKTANKYGGLCFACKIDREQESGLEL
jgi:uncharacterized protein YlaI